VPTLAGPVTVDGQLRDLEKGLRLAPSSGEPAPEVRLGMRGTVLHVGATMKDDAFTPGDLLSVTLQFPSAGVTAPGYVFTFASDGERPEESTPLAVRKKVKSKVVTRGDTTTVELAVPADALPRLPAKGPLLLSLCAEYRDLDAVGGEAQTRSTCSGGSSAGLKLPNSIRAPLLKDVPLDIDGLEPRPGGGVVGFSDQRAPSWLRSQAALTDQRVAELAADKPLEATQLRLFIASGLRGPGNEPFTAVLFGEDPFTAETGCNDEKEVRLAVYARSGKTARRVLEFPVRSCKQGRGTSVTLEGPDTLVIAYDSGATVRFVWAKDHFERSELG
jgi:hypothetical protein